MRKIWYREGRINTGARSTERDMEAVREAETLLRAQPDSRDRHRSLVRALSRAGELERAEEVARDWIERDRLDPEALTYLSDVVGRQGKRELALRLLSGIVDLEPDNVTLQERMANAFERAGKAERACAHRVALAAIRPGDEDLVANAVRCERARTMGGNDADIARGLVQCVEAVQGSLVLRCVVEEEARDRVRHDRSLEALAHVRRVGDEERGRRAVDEEPELTTRVSGQEHRDQCPVAEHVDPSLEGRARGRQWNLATA